MMRFLVVLALAFLSVGIEARLSQDAAPGVTPGVAKEKRGRQLQNDADYGNGNGYNNYNNGNYQGGDGGYYNNGQEAEEQQEEEEEQGYNNYNYDAQDDAAAYEDEDEGDAEEGDDGFHYEDLTVENYEKLLDVHDKMEAYRLATIVLVIIVLLQCVYAAILQCRLDNAQLAPLRAPLRGKAGSRPIV